MASMLTLEEGVEVDAVGQLRHPLHLLWSTDSQAGRQAYERSVSGIKPRGGNEHRLLIM